MTTLAFIFGCLPLWIASGSGAVSRRIPGTLIGILMVPTTFGVVDYLSHRFARGGKGTTMDSSHSPEGGQA